jgi:hypothetical protein
MSNKIKDLLNSPMKPKERVGKIVEYINKDMNLFDELMDIFRIGSDVEKGTCAEVMKFVSKDNPEIVVPYIDELINNINHKVSRVKWGVPESIGNIAQKYPKDAQKAVPNLLKNTKDKSTVVRWCAGYALSEILKYYSEIQDELIQKINVIIKQEKNNGVKNVYLKALKHIGK